MLYALLALWPCSRSSKKTISPFLLRSSRVYTNLTLFTLGNDDRVRYKCDSTLDQVGVDLGFPLVKGERMYSCEDMLVRRKKVLRKDTGT